MGGCLVRQTPTPHDTPIAPETFERLIKAIDSVYPGKWRRALDVCPVAVNKTIDNEADALETIRRIEARES